MTNDDLYREKLGAFLAEMKQLRVSCGKPSLREISAMSERLGELYGDRGRPHDVLTTTALSDILGGRRQGPPPWEKVSAFVLSCQRYGYETRALDNDPGPATLPGWLERLNALESPADAQADDDPDDPVESDPAQPLIGTAAWEVEVDANDPAATDSHAMRPPLELATGEPAIQETPEDDHAGPPYGAAPAAAAQAEPKEQPVWPGEGAGGLSLTAERYLTLFGVHAVDLLNRAEEDHDADAAARLGILLSSTGHPAEGHAWLEKADRGGDVMANAVLSANQAYRRGLAAEFAYELAMQEGNQPLEDPDTAAELYCLASAQWGHPGAAYWIAARHQARGEQENAAYWFSEADRLGHRHASGRFDQIHEQIWARALSKLATEPFPVEWVDHDRAATEQHGPGPKQSNDSRVDVSQEPG